ncbi:ABC transporter substrate-binding protein [Sphaerochaeta halotolerans]|uniref:ABC transporter substrate-binding protein n=1 Tax=Sphaerochaeta halotolerans TaxID=2293840 RepID=A0A372MJR4_9SPIR|nr:ABC transporter substrate-binding protein [Sphaerochaeta halotolerans]RFU95420.1 ABC transporter substrate-binding protein [Sphaerochaeta halotolerans]
MKFRSIVLLLCIIPALLFAQGAPEQAIQERDYYQAVDANGRTLKLQEKPSKVLIAGKAGNMPANALFLFPEVTTMELTIPKTDQGLGDFFSFIRPSLDDNPRISQNASVEEIASYQSDLVLTKATHFESIARKLDQLGVANFTMNLESYEDWKREIVELGKLLQNNSRATEILNLYEERLNPIKQTAASIKAQDKKRVLLLQANTTENTYSYKIAPDTWMQTWMVETIGAEAVWKGSNKAANGWSTVSFEQIAAWDPDIIIVVSYRTPTDQYIEAIYASEIWSSLRAVKTKQVKASPYDMMNYIQPVASWILGLQWMASEVYPERFPDLDMREEVASFYLDFYNLTDEDKLGMMVDRYSKSVAINLR